MGMSGLYVRATLTHNCKVEAMKGDKYWNESSASSPRRLMCLTDVFLPANGSHLNLEPYPSPRFARSCMSRRTRHTGKLHLEKRLWKRETQWTESGKSSTYSQWCMYSQALLCPHQQVQCAGTALPQGAPRWDRPYCSRGNTTLNTVKQKKIQPGHCC